MKEGFKLWLKILLPVVIGVAVVWLLFRREFSTEAFLSVTWDARSAVAILLALLAVAGRDAGMAWRFKALTDGRLSVGQSVNVTFLCEFTSAITPTSVGGSALSMIFMSREGISAGRATTLTMVTLLLDQMFFVIFVPIVVLLIPDNELFGFNSSTGLTTGLQSLFWIIYGAMALWAAVLIAGLFFIPLVVRRLLVRLFSLPILRRWKKTVTDMGDNMVEASHEVRHKPLKWWVQGFAATILSWVSRYLVVNALFWGFMPGAPQMTVFGRQFVVWALLMFSPTPGGSGLSEYLFKEYYGDLITSGAALMVLALLWRILTYYIYLMTGICLLPSFFSKKKSKTQQEE